MGFRGQGKLTDLSRSKLHVCFCVLYRFTCSCPAFKPNYSNSSLAFKLWFRETSDSRDAGSYPELMRNTLTYLGTWIRRDQDLGCTRLVESATVLAFTEFRRQGCGLMICRVLIRGLGIPETDDQSVQPHNACPPYFHQDSQHALVDLREGRVQGLAFQRHGVRSVQPLPSSAMWCGHSHIGKPQWLGIR